MPEGTQQTRAPSQPPRKQDSQPLREVARLGDLFTNAEFVRRVERAVPAVITPTLFLSGLAGSLRKSPLLAECSIADVAAKALFLAQAGLPPDTPLQLSHLIPYKERRWNKQTRKQEDHVICQAVIGYHGLLDLAYRGRRVASVNAAVAWRDEVDARMFEYRRGTEEYLHHLISEHPHDMSAQAQAEGRAEFPAFVYAIAGLADSKVRPFEVWPWHKVAGIRDATPAYRFATQLLEQSHRENKPVGSGFLKAPWIAFTEKMAMKTMVKQLLNYLPRSVEYASVAALDDAQERRAIDLGPIIEGRAEDQDYVAAAADAAEETGDPGAAFGVREPAPPPPEPKPQTEARRPAQRAAPKPPEPEPEPEAAAEEPPADRWDEPPAETNEAPSEFVAYLFNDIGELISEEVFTDPVAFARAYAEAIPKQADRATFIENNADGVNLAIESTEAAAILEEATRAPQTPATVPMRAPEIVLAESHGKKDYKSFIADARTILQTVPRELLVDFIERHKPKLADAVASVRIQFAMACGERGKAVGVDTREALTELMSPRAAAQAAMPMEQPPTSTEQHEAEDARLVDRFQNELAELSTKAQIARWRSQDFTARAIGRLERETPSQYQRLQRIIDERLAAVSR